MCIFALTLLALFNAVFSDTRPCDYRTTKYGAVCRCTAQYCDYLDVSRPEDDRGIIVVSSSKNGLRFAVTNATFGRNETQNVRDFNERSKTAKKFNPTALIIENDGRTFYQLDDGQIFRPLKLRRGTARIIVDRTKTYQKIVGFGGALTGAVSIHLQKLSSDLQDHMYKSFFHDSGIKFNMIRTSIGGCDFDLEPWAYNEQPIDDTSLSNFTKLDDRDLMKVQQMQRIKDVANLKDLKIMAAAWSPPKWMKTNNDWTGFSFLKTEYYQTWADYHLRFIELMASKNMTIWAISTGNEPLNGVIAWYFVRFMSMGWTPSNQVRQSQNMLLLLRDQSNLHSKMILYCRSWLPSTAIHNFSVDVAAIWLSEHLGPTIKNSKHKDVLIFGNDDQRYTYPAWFRTMNASRSTALNYLDGLAVHWYWDDIFAPTLIDAAHKAMPDKILLNTESCIGDKPWQTHGPELGSWERGEQYIRSFIQDLQHSFNGWIDWNLLLNEKGGPNYVHNHVDAPIILNTTDYQEFYKQPIFYALGHFSKFLPPDSIRVSVESSDSSVETVGFQRPDGSIAVILHNTASVPMEVSLIDSLRGKFIVYIPSRSVHSIVYN